MCLPDSYAFTIHDDGCGELQKQQNSKSDKPVDCPADAMGVRTYRHHQMHAHVHVVHAAARRAATVVPTSAMPGRFSRGDANES